MTLDCARVADDLGVDLEAIDAIDAPADGELVTIPVDDYTWLLVTSDTVAMVMIDADDDVPFEQIIASFEVVDWATLKQHTEDAGFYRGTRRG